MLPLACFTELKLTKAVKLESFTGLFIGNLVCKINCGFLSPQSNRNTVLYRDYVATRTRERQDYGGQTIGSNEDGQHNYKQSDISASDGDQLEDKSN